MRSILTISRLTFLIFFRSGMVWGVIALVSGLTTLIFFLSSGDNVLVNELKLRIQYSYAITYSLITLIVISVSCFAIRSQLDGRQIHMLTSYPISRKKIWIGKWLGVMGISCIAETVLFLCLVFSCLLYSRSYSKDVVRNAFSLLKVIHHESHPIQKSFKQLTNERIKSLVQAGQLDSGAINESVRKTIFSQILREKQLIPPNGEKTWRFDLGKRPKFGDHVLLKFKFYAEKKRKSISGTWFVNTPGKVEAYEESFEVYPFKVNTIKIPLDQIPDTGKFEVTLKGQNTRDIIISSKTGLRVYYENGSLYKNMFKAFAFQIIHLGVTAAVGLTAGVALTFAVATFVSIVLYIMSISSGFFEVIVQGLTHGYHVSLADQLAVYAINFGLWFTKGLQPPKIVGFISSGISIPVNELILTWFPVVFVYVCVASFLGIYLLERKELDKILT